VAAIRVVTTECAKPGLETATPLTWPHRDASQLEACDLVVDPFFGAAHALRPSASCSAGSNGRGDPAILDPKPVRPNERAPA